MRISDWSSDVCSSDLPAAVVAAGGNGIEQRVMQPPDDRPQTAFQHPMKLEGLARRDTQGVAAMCASKFVELQPLCRAARSEEHTSELQSLMRISYAVFCLKKKTNRI